MAQRRALRSYAEYIDGDGENTGLTGVLREAFKSADSEDAKSKNEGKPVGRVTLFIEAETKTKKWNVFNRDINVSQEPAAIGAAILRSLENDPGPSFEGDIRTYIRIAGKTERLSPGSFQRPVATGFVSADSVESGNIVIPLPVWNGVVLPLLSSVQQMATECARGTHESAQSLVATGTIFKAIGDGVGTAVGAFKAQTQDSGLFGNVMKAFTGMATAGVPGAGQAAAAAAGAQQIATATFGAKMPLADRPALFGAGGGTTPDTPPAPFGSTFAGPVSSVGASSPGASTGPAQATPVGSGAPPKVGKAEVLDYLKGASNDDAREVAAAYLDAKGMGHLKGMLP